MGVGCVGCYVRQTPRLWRQGAFDRVAQVDQDMVAIRDLLSARRSTCGCLRIGPSTVATDDLHATMHTQPANNGVGFPIREYLHRTTRLQVDQQRAVAVAFFPGEIVDARHLWGLAWWNSCAADAP